MCACCADWLCFSSFGCSGKAVGRSQSDPSPAAEANPDGSTTVYFGPTQPMDVKRGNWIQTMPGKGWLPLLRFYSPLEPFFDKSVQSVSDETGRIIHMSPECGKVCIGARHLVALVFCHSFGAHYSRLGVNQVCAGQVNIGM